MPRRASNLEAEFLTLWRQVLGHLDEPVPEYRFCESRRWRFDYALPDHKVAIELDGGAYTQGRHTRGNGFEKDLEKLNAATLMGWRVLRFTRGMLRADPVRCLDQVEALIDPVPFFDSLDGDGEELIDETR